MFMPYHTDPPCEGHHLGPGEIDRLLVPPGKASTLLVYTTDRPSDYWLIKSEPAQEKWFKQIIHTYKPYLFAWVVISMKHMFMKSVVSS